MYFSTMAALLGKQKFHIPKANPAAHQSEVPKEPTVTEGPSWEFHNPEIERLIEELHKERKALAQRESQLQELAKRIQAEKQDLAQVTQRVAILQKDFDETVVKVSAEESANLKKLAKVYGKMSSGGAATIFKEMADEQVVKQLLCMKENEVSAILEAMSKESPPAMMSKRTAAIANRLRLAGFEPATAKNP